MPSSHEQPPRDREPERACAEELRGRRVDPRGLGDAPLAERRVPDVLRQERQLGRRHAGVPAVHALDDEVAAGPVAGGIDVRDVEVEHAAEPSSTNNPIRVIEQRARRTDLHRG